jgi:hypothetical protein
MTKKINFFDKKSILVLILISILQSLLIYSLFYVIKSIKKESFLLKIINHKLFLEFIALMIGVCFLQILQIYFEHQNKKIQGKNTQKLENIKSIIGYTILIIVLDSSASFLREIYKKISDKIKFYTESYTFFIICFFVVTFLYKLISQIIKYCKDTTKDKIKKSDNKLKSKKEILSFRFIIKIIIFASLATLFRIALDELFKKLNSNDKIKEILKGLIKIDGVQLEIFSVKIFLILFADFILIVVADWITCAILKNFHNQKKEDLIVKSNSYEIFSKFIVSVCLTVSTSIISTLFLLNAQELKNPKILTAIIALLSISFIFFVYSSNYMNKSNEEIRKDLPEIIIQIIDFPCFIKDSYFNNKEKVLEL